MRFKSENMVLNTWIIIKNVSEEENNAYIPDKYFYYQVYLNLVHVFIQITKNKISARISIKPNALTVVTNGYLVQNSPPNM